MGYLKKMVSPCGIRQDVFNSKELTGSPLAQISLSDITGKINFKCLFLYPLRLLSILLHFRKITKKHDKNLISPTHY